LPPVAPPWNEGVPVDGVWVSDELRHGDVVRTVRATLLPIASQ